MQIKDVINHLESLSPLQYAEGFDNVGLLTGQTDWEVKGILVTLDTLEATVDEAIAKNCNLIVSFHPIIFNGLKRLTGKTYVERTVIKAIQNNIAIYALHTALDNQKIGVSGKMAAMLGLHDVKVLIPKSETIKKLTTYVPIQNVDQVRKALFSVGAGNIGNYAECSFNSEGYGTYTANAQANPTLGEIGKWHQEPETALVVYFEKHLEAAILKALFQSHPYEEVAYEVKTLDNLNQNIGMGVYGSFENAISELEFLKRLQTTFNTTNIRHSNLLQKEIKTVALLGGSGSFALQNAKRVGAQAFVSADFKYHEFYSAEQQILIADIGHYESEQFTKNLILDLIQKKFTTFAVILSETHTNPVFNYH
jgi:dinuclear metal center YbgI/SA1388 family protein